MVIRSRRLGWCWAPDFSAQSTCSPGLCLRYIVDYPCTAKSYFVAEP